MESANSKPDNKTAVSEEPKAKEQNDIAKENVAKSNNSNSIEATQEEGPSLKEVIKQNLIDINVSKTLLRMISCKNDCKMQSSKRCQVRAR